MNRSNADQSEAEQSGDASVVWWFGDGEEDGDGVLPFGGKQTATGRLTFGCKGGSTTVASCHAHLGVVPEGEDED
jgi:hypothetical protein